MLVHILAIIYKRLRRYRRVLIDSEVNISEVSMQNLVITGCR